MENTTKNLFNMEGTVPKSTETRRLEFTPVLIDKSNSRAQELMTQQYESRPDLNDLVSRVLQNGDAQSTFELLNEFFGETISSDATLLSGCDDDQLDRLLESRRSDRSKTKSKGLTNAVNIKNFLAAAYAELMIREFSGKVYKSNTSGAIDIESIKDDADAIKRKVKSLQSKACRLRKIAPYDETMAQQLRETEEEISRLNELRPTIRVSTKTAIKDSEVDAIREALKLLDVDSLDDDERLKVMTLIQKLG